MYSATNVTNVTSAVQMYLAVINEMYSVLQPSLMKCTKASQMYLAVINEMYLSSIITFYK